MLSRMDPGTEHQSTGLLVIRPVGVIGVTLSVVDTREDTPDFSLCCKNADRLSAITSRDVDVSGGRDCGVMIGI